MLCSDFDVKVFRHVHVKQKLNRYHLIAAGNYVILRDNIGLILLSALLSPSEPRRRHVATAARPRQPPGQRGLRPAAAARPRYLLRESVSGQHEVDPHTGCFLIIIIHTGCF